MPAGLVRSVGSPGVLKSWGLPNSKGGLKTYVFVARHRYVPPLRTLLPYRRGGREG